MAENKKSFVAYADWENQLDLLSDDEAGKLFRHLLAFVNDKNPQFSAEDRILKMAFEPIRLQLKRDLEKYNEVKKKRSEAGRSGGLKSGESRSKTEQNEANTSCDEPKEANALFAQKNEANEAVNDNVTVNVNDNVNVNDILLEKESKSDFQSEEVPTELFEEPKQPDLGKRKKVPPKKEKDEVELVYHFDTATFRAQWDLFKVFRKTKHKFTFLDNDSENRKLTELFNLSNGDEKLAIKIIQNSIDNGYRGLFLPKNHKNEQSTNNNSSAGFTKTTTTGSNAASGKTSATSAIARQLAKLSAGNSQSGDFAADAEIV